MTENIVTMGSDTFSLDEWVAKVVNQVKAEPGNMDVRWQLCKLYCLQADWDRALRQLETLEKIDSESNKQQELYKNLLLSERLRESVLGGERKAGSLEGTLPEWTELLQEANGLFQRGEHEKAENLRQQALEQATAHAGRCENMGEFSWITDGDDRLGPVCEFIFAGGYRWVPFADIHTLEIKSPQGITDFVWAPATLTTADRSLHGFIPARYPVTKESEQKYKTGLETLWEQPEKTRYTGQGRKMWMSSVGECSLFEAGKLTINVVEDECQA